MAKKIITVLLIILLLVPIDITAADLAIGEYGLGFVRTRSVDPYFSQNVFRITSYPYLKTSMAQSKTPYWYAQFGWLPDYTYTVTVDFRTSQPNYFTTGTFDFYRSSGYVTNSYHDGYDNVKWSIIDSYLLDDEIIPFVVSSTSEPWTNPDDLQTSYTHITYTIVFSNAEIGMEDLEYLVARFPIELPNGAISILQPNMDVQAVYDPGGDVYQQIIVDMIAELMKDNKTYQTNALEVLDQIKAGQDKTNESLDKLPDTLDEALDKAEDREYDKATDDGDENVGAAVDALTGVINVGSILDAIQPLITACSYAGTTSVWSFPSITLPAIDGVMDEMKLNDPINFDLTEYAAQYLPSAIITLIRSIGTIGIIVFAAKEIMRIVKGVGKNDG